MIWVVVVLDYIISELLEKVVGIHYNRKNRTTQHKTRQGNPRQDKAKNRRGQEEVVWQGVRNTYYLVCFQDGPGVTSFCSGTYHPMPQCSYMTKKVREES